MTVWHLHPFDHPAFVVASDSVWRARHRRHQSWYRTVELGVPPGTSRAGTSAPSEHRIRGVGRQPGGNLLAEGIVFVNPSLNFLLDQELTSYVIERVGEIQREGGMVDEHRLWHNLLSSMPMCSTSSDIST